MTKLVKTWQKFSFWNKIRLTLGAVGIGGEVTLYLGESYPHWKILAGAATIACIIITYGFKDDNNNNIVDFLEKPKKDGE